MKGIEEVLRYGSIKKDDIYNRDELDEYVNRYCCIMIEENASRGILSSNFNNKYKIKDIIKNVGGNFSLGETVISNKFFEEAIIVEKI